MSATLDQYYAELASEYEVSIRQLVPRYDDMLACVVDLVASAKPGTVLDAGTGPGTVARLLLERLPRAAVTAVDASEAMVNQARDALAVFGARATVVHRDLASFTTAEPFDVVCSNLVLHNVPYADKPVVFRALHDWLAPAGVLVLGDFIRHDDLTLQEHTVRYRMAFAREAGCPKRLLEWNFRKETNEDSPLTVEETLDALVAAGFERPVPVWLHDAFLVVRAHAGSGGRSTANG